MIAEAINLYNYKRLYRFLEINTPTQAHVKQKHTYTFYKRKNQLHNTERNVDRLSTCSKMLAKSYQYFSRFEEKYIIDF